MCGICGEIRFDGKQPGIETLQAMNAVLVPRGPDAGGIHQMNHIAVGHRRLKIIDLSEHAQQPMVDNELGLGIVFNGCIYNYRELRAELRSLGYRFFSEGDTEVILKSYHAWGTRCVDRFHGMFAFGIWERDTGRLVLARDRLGIKPLYFTEIDGGLRFASTLVFIDLGSGRPEPWPETLRARFAAWPATSPVHLRNSSLDCDPLPRC